MSVNEVLKRGWFPRSERGNPARVAYARAESLRRFNDLAWLPEARRIDLRAAHRRWLRRLGKSFR